MHRQDTLFLWASDIRTMKDFVSQVPDGLLEKWIEDLPEWEATETLTGTTRGAQRVRHRRGKEYDKDGLRLTGAAGNDMTDAEKGAWIFSVQAGALRALHARCVAAVKQANKEVLQDPAKLRLTTDQAHDMKEYYVSTDTDTSLDKALLFPAHVYLEKMYGMSRPGARVTHMTWETRYSVDDEDRCAEKGVDLMKRQAGITVSGGELGFQDTETSNPNPMVQEGQVKRLEGVLRTTRICLSMAGLAKGRTMDEIHAKLLEPLEKRYPDNFRGPSMNEIRAADFLLWQDVAKKAARGDRPQATLTAILGDANHEAWHMLRQRPKTEPDESLKNGKVMGAPIRPKDTGKVPGGPGQPKVPKHKGPGKVPGGGNDPPGTCHKCKQNVYDTNFHQNGMYCSGAKASQQTKTAYDSFIAKNPRAAMNAGLVLALSDGKETKRARKKRKAEEKKAGADKDAPPKAKARGSVPSWFNSQTQSAGTSCGNRICWDYNHPGGSRCAPKNGMQCKFYHVPLTKGPEGFGNHDKPVANVTPKAVPLPGSG